MQQGEQSLKSKEWREVVERKALRGRLWKIFGSHQSLREMWEYFTLEGQEQERFQRTIHGKSKRRFWNRSKEMRMQTVVPKWCVAATLQ